MGFAKLVVNIVEVGNLEAGIETRHRVFFFATCSKYFFKLAPNTNCIILYCTVAPAGICCKGYPASGLGFEPKLRWAQRPPTYTYISQV
jgi:hypothetical protein